MQWHRTSRRGTPFSSPSPCHLLVAAFFPRRWGKGRRVTQKSLTTNVWCHQASWQPGGRAVALAFSRSTQIVMLHFISPPPELRAQMLPLDLPDLRMSKNPEVWSLRGLPVRHCKGREGTPSLLGPPSPLLGWSPAKQPLERFSPCPPPSCLQSFPLILALPRPSDPDAALQAVEIQSMAWDQAGGRLAVAIEGEASPSCS